MTLLYGLCHATGQVYITPLQCSIILYDSVIYLVLDDSVLIATSVAIR